MLITSGPMAGKRFEVGPGGVRLGRSSSNDISIPDEELSRNHCLIEQSGEAGVRITDLASANGTFVNGEQLFSDPRELRAGDSIEVGSTTISVVGTLVPRRLLPKPRRARPAGMRGARRSTSASARLPAPRRRAMRRRVPPEGSRPSARGLCWPMSCGSWPRSWWLRP